MPTPLAENEMLPQEAKMKAQFIALAPFVFQASLCLRNFGILESLGHAPNGMTFDELHKQTGLSHSSLGILLDAGLSSEMIFEEKGVYTLSQIGHFVQNDKITRVNMDFTQDVCYQGLFHLEEALKTNTPAGLKVFGKWKTIYEGLSSLPEKAKKSWLEFDHFFSDDCLQRSVPIVFKNIPQRILDIGGNTGKFARACLQHDSNVQVTLVDHPGQIEMAKANAAQWGLTDRLHYFAADLLNPDQELPMGHDVIWMSQFLSCFSPEQIVSILRKARLALPPGGSILIMETFTDNQKFSVSRFCLDMTSLYFTALANGTSRMYRREHFLKYVAAAELGVVEEFPHVRLNHTVLKCQPVERK